MSGDHRSRHPSTILQEESSATRSSSLRRGRDLSAWMDSSASPPSPGPGPPRLDEGDGERVPEPASEGPEGPEAEKRWAVNAECFIIYSALLFKVRQQH